MSCAPGKTWLRPLLPLLRDTFEGFTTRDRDRAAACLLALFRLGGEKAVHDERRQPVAAQVEVGVGQVAHELDGVRAEHGEVGSALRAGREPGLEGDG